MYFSDTAIWSIGELDVHKDIFVIAIACLLMCGAWFTMMRHTSSYFLKLLLAFFIMLAAAAPFLELNDIFQIVVPQLLAVLALGITYLVIENTSSPT